MINGKTVGTSGLGNIGSKVAKLVTAFGATVQYYDIERKYELEEQYGYKFVSQDELLRTSDIVTLHTPLTDLTRNMIDGRRSGKNETTGCINQRSPRPNRGRGQHWWTRWKMAVCWAQGWTLTPTNHWPQITNWCGWTT